MILRAMYFMLGGMVGIMLGVTRLNMALEGVLQAIPYRVGAAAWHGCTMGKVSDTACMEIGRQVAKATHEEILRGLPE